MTTETSRLIIVVDSTSALKAQADLDKLTAAAARAETATGKLGSTSGTAGRAVKVSADATSAAAVSAERLAESEAEAEARIKAMVQASLAAVEASKANAAASVAATRATSEGASASKALADAQTAAMQAATKTRAPYLAVQSLLEKSTITTAEFNSASLALARSVGAGAITAGEYREALAALDAAKIKDIAVTEAESVANKTAGLNASAQSEIATALSEILAGNFGRLRRTGSAFANQAGLLQKIMSPLGLAITGVSGAVIGFTAAVLKAEEVDAEFNKALLATNEHAGITAGQMHAMAAGMVDATHGAGDIHDALIAVVSSGKFAGDQIQTVARAAVDMANVTGRSVGQAVAQFEQIGGDPVDAARKLNSEYHFLTGRVYDQIQALQEQGNTEAATRVLVDQLAQAMDTAATKAKAHIGTLHGMWAELKRDLKLPLDVFTAVADQTQHSVTEQFEVAKSTLQFYQKQGGVSATAGGGFTTGPGFARYTAADQQNIRTTIALYNKVRGAAEAAEQAAADRSYAQQLEENAEAAQAWANSAIRGYDKVVDRAQAVIDVTKKMSAMVSGNKALPPGVYQLGQKFSGPGFDYMVNKEVGGSSKRASGKTSGDYIASFQDTYAKMVAKGATALNEQTAAQAKAQVGNEAYAQQLATQLSLREKAIDLQVAAVGMGQKEIQRMQEKNQVYLEFNDQLRRLNDERDRGSISIADYNTRLQDMKDAEGATIAALEAGWKRLDAAQGDWHNGLTAALQDFMDQSSDVAGQTQAAFSNLFNGMADSVSNFVKTGKGDLEDLARSFLADVTRMEAAAAESALFGWISRAFSGVGDNGSAGYANYIPATSGNTAIGVGFAKGDVFNNSPSLARYENGVYSTPQFFAYAKGGVFAEDGEEAIMPLTRGSDGKLGVKAQASPAPPVKVIIENHGSDKAQVTQSKDASGTDVIKIVVGKVKSDLTNEVVRGGPFGKAIQQSFGLQRRGVPVA